MSFNVGGIASGIDTNSLIDGLMAVERQAVNRLEASKTRANDEIKAWDLIEKRIDESLASIESIRSGNSLASATATSSDTSVVRATARTGALPGTYAFRVETLATAQQLSSAPISSGSALTGAGVATAASGFAARGLTIVSDTFGDDTHRITLIEQNGTELTFSVNGDEQTVIVDGSGSFTLDDGSGGALTVSGGAALAAGDPIATGTMSYTKFTADGTTTVSQLAAAFNDVGGSVRAQVIDTGGGGAAPHRLVLTARSTGTAAAAAIDLSGLSLFSGGLTTLRAPSDATISLGDGALTITRPTNTVTDAFDGLTIDLIGIHPDSEVEIVVESDLDAQVAAVKDVVSSITRVLSQVSAATKYDVDTRTGAPLVGSSAARAVGSQISSAMRSVLTSGPFVVLSQIGVKLGSDGTYSLDEAVLRSALLDDPEAVQQALVGSSTDDGDGILDVVAGVLESLTDPSSRIGTSREAAQATIKDLDGSIAMQEARLVVAEQRYRAQFTAMETALGQLQSQSNYLTSALGGGS